MNKTIALLTAMFLLAAANLPAEKREIDELDHECTSWMILSDLTGNGTHILHKNRDATSRNIVVMKNAPDAPRRWIGLGNDGFLCMGINAAGLAAVMNSGEPCIDPPNVKGKKRTPEILKAILESCDNAEQAVETLRGFLRAGDYSHGQDGSIFFFLDREEGVICETTAKFCSVQHYRDGYAFRANIWRNPGMEQQRARKLPARFQDSCGRESVVKAMLDAALDRKKKIELPDILALARQNKKPDGSPMKRSVCFAKTNSAATLVLNREFPAVLSTAYVLVGHPRHTICLTVPVCVKNLDCGLGEPVWAAASWNRFDALGLGAPIPENWTAFERKSLAEYEQASAEALSLLRKGDQAQAVQKLNETAAKIWREAYSLAVEPNLKKPEKNK